MNNLLQSQIQESCRLALPEGLKDLMSDISREVLRAQPQNIYQFIANYLEVLLEAREALTIACQVCNDTCECTCEPELENDLRGIGMVEDDIDNAVKIIEDHFKIGAVKEQNLFIKLLKKSKIDEEKMSAIQEIIQKSFKRNLLKQSAKHGNRPDDETIKAVKHTLRFYDQSKAKIQDQFISNRVSCTESTTSFASSDVIHHVGFTQEFNISQIPKEDSYSISDNKISIETVTNEKETDKKYNGDIVGIESNEFDRNDDMESVNSEHEYTSTNLENLNELNDVYEGIEEEIDENIETSSNSSIDESIQSLGNDDDL